MYKAPNVTVLHLDPNVALPSAPKNDIVTEDSAALRFADLYAGKLRYCHDSGRWFEWSGTHWSLDRTAKAFNWARELVRHLAENEPAKVRAITSKVAFCSGVEKYAQRDPALAVTAADWDADPFLLATPGGTVDLKTGKLRAARPQDGITKLTTVAPAETAACPLWLRFLAESTGSDRELIRFLQQWTGYSLTGDTREHALAFVYGPGGNGKSVFLSTVSRIVGEYAVTASMDSFTASRGDRHPTDLAMLRGARLVTVSETEEGRAWAESRIKQLTGGDPISARFMHKDFFTFQPAFKLTIVGNHQPILRNVDDAARRRFNFIPFTRKPANPDRDLEAKLSAEAPSILRWMVDGCLDWQKNGLERPESVLAATREYFEGQDTVGQWLADECDAEPENTYKTATSAALFESWSTFAKAAQEEPGSNKRFAAEMERRGFRRHKGTGGVREWRGIRLKPKGNRHDFG